METLTWGQRRALMALDAGPQPTANVRSFDHFLAAKSHDSIHQILRRLEDRELVRRVDTEPWNVWQLTGAGRKALASPAT